MKQSYQSIIKKIDTIHKKRRKLNIAEEKLQQQLLIQIKPS
jgi:hypothetical protein